MTRIQYREDIYEVEDKQIECVDRIIPIRIYRAHDKVAPALVYYHGGGYVTGSLDTHDSICRTLANEVKCTVISIDYRLAPEYKFPAGVEDCYDALDWIATHASELLIDPARLAVGGDSAGGTLATVSALIAIERGGPSIRHQLLFYPAIGEEHNLPLSMIDYSNSYSLDENLVKWFQDQYYEEKNEVRHPYANPNSSNYLAQLPPTTLMTVEYDPLKEVGKAYANKLISLGIPVDYKNYGGLIHGFTNYYSYVPEARRAVNDAIAALRKAFQVA